MSDKLQSAKEMTVRKFMLKKFPTSKYIDCPIPQHHWETIQEYAEAYAESYHSDKMEELRRELPGVVLILEERKEQIEKHGWDKDHDFEHRYGELAKVAATLLVMPTDVKVKCPDGEWGSGDNPWGLESKLANDRIHALKVAGALVAAELDRELQLIERGANA